MIFFITFLRALAACLITNAHYTGVYPSDIIANGGLLGDVIFFAVSGYCLYSAKGSFPKWYGKRLWRVYLPVVLMTAIYLLIGAYELSEGRGILWWLAYPTNYHFVASIILLYIPFYAVMKISWLRKSIPAVMTGIGLVFLFVYVFFYDKSYYHIDTVREPMIRFLFFESMLLGAYFRHRDKDLRNKRALPWAILSAGLFVLYFASKLIISRRASLAEVQIINQIIIFALLYAIFRTFSALDSRLEKLPSAIKRVITYISTITLEIYLVQYVIIDLLRTVAPFPVNWLALTASILAAASVLHFVCKGIYMLVDMLIKLIISRTKKEEKAQ